MRIKNYLLVGMVLLIGELSGYAQCDVQITGQEAIICGDKVQLHAAPLWEDVHGPINGNAISSFFTSKDIGYAGTINGTVHKTIDGGKTWSSKVINAEYFLVGLYFTDLNTGYLLGRKASGSDSKIFKTTDAGDNWVEIFNNASMGVYSIVFVNANTGFVTGSNGLLLKTSDAGANWITKTTNSTADILKVQLFDANNGYAPVSTGDVLKTTDGGETWALKTGITKKTMRDAYFTDQNSGYAVAGDSIFKTIDGGANWTKQVVNTNSWSLFRVSFSDANTGYVLGVDKVWKTIDAGKSWIYQSVPGVYGAQIHFPAPKVIYIVGYQVHKLTMPDVISWSPSTGLNATNISDPIANPIVTTKYKVTTTTGTCVKTDSVTVTVNPLTVGAGGNKAIICGGSSQLEAVSNYTGTGSLAYSWSPATGLNSTTIANPISSATTTTRYHLTITTPNGCTATDSSDVFVYPLTINTMSNKTLTCGGVVQLDKVQTSYTGTGILTYSWSPTTGLNAANIADPQASPTETTKYYITVTSPTGCTVRDSVTVFVNPFVASAGNDKLHFCGESSQLDNVTSNYTGSTALAYSWLPTTGLNSATIPNPISSSDGITYTVTVTTANGCQAVDEVKVGVTVMNAFDICMVGVDSTGKNIVIWNNPVSTATDSVFIYKETNVSGNYVKIGSASSSKNTFRDEHAQPNVKSSRYKISLLDSCALETEKSAAHKTMHLAITKGIGSSWNLIWEKYEGFVVPTYNIYRGTSQTDLQFIDAVSGGSNQFTNYNPPPGDLYYQVEVVNPNPCSTSNLIGALRSNVAASVTVGIQETNDESFSFSVYPNPSAAFITFTIESPKIKNTVITLYNTIGEAVKTVTVDQNNQQINISDLENGFYMIELQSGHLFSKQKLIIQK